MTLPPGGTTQSLASMLGIGNPQPAVGLGAPGVQLTSGPITTALGNAISSLPSGQGATQGIAQGGPAPIGGNTGAQLPPINFPNNPTVNG